MEEEPELIRLVRIVEQYTDAIPEILAGLKTRYCADERQAKVIVSTAHKAKGREWDHVIILDDFLTPTQLRAMLSRKRINPREYTAEINLLYVACTRGKVSLSIAQPLFDEIAGGAGLSDQLFDPM
jgi:superfamily I DNA/RNA helicase